MRHSSYIPVGFFILIVCTQGWGWEFNTGKDGWVVTNAIADLQAVDGKLVATVAANMNDPYINGPNGP